MRWPKILQLMCFLAPALAACASEPVRGEAQEPVPYGERPGPEVQKVVNDVSARLAGCFSLGPNHPSWTMAVALGPDGSPIDVRLDAFVDLPTSAQWCGKETLRALRFPAEPGAVRVMLAALTAHSGDPVLSQVLIQRVDGAVNEADPLIQVVLDRDMARLRLCRGRPGPRSVQPGFSRGVRDAGDQVAIDDPSRCLERMLRSMTRG